MKDNYLIQFGKLKGRPHSDFCLPENKGVARWIVNPCDNEKFKDPWDFIHNNYPDSVDYIIENVDTDSNPYRSIGNGYNRQTCSSGFQCKSDEKYRCSTVDLQNIIYTCRACTNTRKDRKSRMYKYRKAGLVIDPVVSVVPVGKMPLG